MPATSVEFPAVHDITIEAARTVESAARSLWPDQPVTAGPFTVTLDAGGSATAPVPALDDGAAEGTLEITSGRAMQRYADHPVQVVFRGKVRVAAKTYTANRTFVSIDVDDGLIIDTGWASVVTERGASAHQATQEQAQKLIQAAIEAALAAMTPADVRELLRAVIQAGQVASVIASAEATIAALAAVGRDETSSI